MSATLIDIKDAALPDTYKLLVERNKGEVWVHIFGNVGTESFHVRDEDIPKLALWFSLLEEELDAEV